MLDYKIDVFLRVAQLLSISRAARDLNISQPAVTTAVQKLEEHFGIKLFFRYSSGLELTPAGSRLFGHLKELKDRSTLAENEMMQLQRTAHGYLQLGASPTFGDYILPKLIGRFSTIYPQISYSLQIGNNLHIYKQLHEGRIELAFLVGKLPGKRLTASIIMEDELVLIVAPGHPWSRRGSISKAELPVQPLILRERGSGSRSDMEEALLELSLPLDKLTVIAEFQSLEAIKSAVESNLGAALISRRAITKELKLNTLVTVKIDGFAFHRDVHAVKIQDARLTEAASRLLELSLTLSKEAIEPV